MTRGVPTRSPRKAAPRIGAYAAWGAVGYVVGSALVGVLAAELGLTLAGRAIIALVPPMTFLVAVKLVQLALGHERIVFYEQAILAVAAAAVAAWLGGVPVATTIDLVTIGVGAFLAFGRVGCYRVACCYGRPATRGVRYDAAAARAGFPARWVGRPLIPLQLVDGALAGAAVAVALTVLRVADRPGLAAVAFAAVYGVGRTILEFLRGDAVRPRWAGASEAQWAAAATVTAAARWRPSAWSVGAAALVVGAVALVALARWRGWWPRMWLTSAWHVDEVATAIGELVAHGGQRSTSEGVTLSAHALPDGRIDVVASRATRPLPIAAVGVLAARLGRPWAAVEVRGGQAPGVLHVLLTRAADG